MSELAADAVDKSPIVVKIILTEILELNLHYFVFGFGMTFILMPLLDNQSAEE